MVAAQKHMTVEEFDQFILRPENVDRRYEYIAGEIVEVVSNPYSSTVAALILGALVVYRAQNDIGYVTGADGGYWVSGERYIPDAAFIRYEKQPILSYVDGYIPAAPDLAVEVLSPSNADDDMAVKVANYLAAGTVLWIGKPLAQQIAVLIAGQPVKIYGVDDTLNGGEILPGFQLAVKSVFPPMRKA